MSDSASGFSCPLCGATRATPAYDFEQGSYVRCAICQLLSLHPMPEPEALIGLYDADYYGDCVADRRPAQDGERHSEVRCVGEQLKTRPSATHDQVQTEGYGAYAEQRQARTRSFRRYAKEINKKHPRGRVLDVGCALGFFLEAALEQGLDVHGIDASEAAISSIQPKFGSRVRSGTLDSLLPSAQASFDVVFASDLIEHVPTPLSFIEHVRGLLKPEGEFWGITPNAESLLARVSGRRWVSFKPPEHVILYTPRHLRRLLSPHFTNIRIAPALQEYPATLVAERVSDLLGPAAALAQRAGQSLGSRSLRVPDGNMRVRAKRR